MPWQKARQIRLLNEPLIGIILTVNILIVCKNLQPDLWGRMSVFSLIKNADFHFPPNLHMGSTS